MKNQKNTTGATFVVFVESALDDSKLLEAHESYRLRENLFLVRSSLTQSKLYHDIKRRLQPSQLFVGTLEGDPKFKSMEEGSLKWLREG